jgi:DNA topoisomerase IB
VTRLRHSRLDTPGWTREPHADTWKYFDERGAAITAIEQRDRLDSLVVPPAWEHVWLSPFANDHIQAVGVDAAGRRQYIYHPSWVVRRSKTKHDHVLNVAATLPAARRRNLRRLKSRGTTKEAVLALAFRLLEPGMFRVGGERYAHEHSTFGLATLERRHLTIDGDTLHFEYDAKSHQHRDIQFRDPVAARLLSKLQRRDDSGRELLAWLDVSGWHGLTSTDINHYLRQLFNADVSAKDFRTWRATTLMATALARTGRPGSRAARARLVTAAVREVADFLGNTPTVARGSYIDPRLIDRYEEGHTIASTRGLWIPSGAAPPLKMPPVSPSTEKAVLRLLA